MAVTVRRAVEKDVPRVMELLVQVNMVHHKGRPDLFKGPTTKYNEEELAEIFCDDSKPVFVAEDETGKVLGHGFCVFQGVKDHPLLEDVKTLYIDDICVDEACRGMHVGNAIYEHILQFAKDSGCYNVTLNVWECNPGARAFYEKMGLVPQKTTMEKIL